MKMQVIKYASLSALRMSFSDWDVLSSRRRVLEVAFTLTTIHQVRRLSTLETHDDGGPDVSYCNDVNVKNTSKIRQQEERTSQLEKDALKADDVAHLLTCLLTYMGIFSQR